MISFQRWHLVVSVLGLIAFSAFLTPPTEKPEVNPYGDYLSSAIFVSQAEADEVYSCNEECDPDEGPEGTCATVSEAVYCGMQAFMDWDIINGFHLDYECDSFIADDDDPDCQPTNP